MPQEVWAAYSVKDHCASRAFIADVMLYDRLVLPVPSDEVSAEGKTEWDRWKDNDWQPYRLQMLLKVLGDVAITIPWTQARQQRWRARRDALREDAFWVTADLLSNEVPIYAWGTAATVGPAYPSLEELRRDLNPVDEAARAPIPAGALPVVLGQQFLVIDDPHRSYEYQIETALDLARDPEFKKKRASLTQWQQQFLRNGFTDRASLKKALEVMHGLIEDQQAMVRKTPLQTTVRYGYRIGMTAMGVLGPLLGGPVGMALTVGSASLSVGELAVDAKVLEPAQPVAPDQPAAAAFFIAARKAFAKKG